MSVRIEQYAMIGDCETAALVSHQGSIDWLCWPHFASPACFAALMGTEDNGYWSIAPENPVPGRRRYLDHTLVLETLFETPDGLVAVVDFMPVRQRNSHLVRIVRGLSGSVPMKMRLALRFEYGRTVPWVTRTENGALRAIAGPDMVVFRSTEEHRGENLQTFSEFTIKKGETATFVLTYGLSIRGSTRDD